jgi:hypothetical protein
MTKADGSKAASDEDNAKASTDHLRKLLQRAPKADQTAVDEVPQQPCHVEVGRMPATDETDAAVRKLIFSESGVAV